MKVVAFLQNAWSPVYAGEEWPRDLWLRALHLSRSGRRLYHMEAFRARHVEIYYENTTPICGATAKSVVPADPEHIKAVLHEQLPDAVVTLGKQAYVSVRGHVSTPLLWAPHPAYRPVTNKLWRVTGELLADGWTGTVFVRQDRGSVTVWKLHGEEQRLLRTVAC